MRTEEQTMRAYSYREVAFGTWKLAREQTCGVIAAAIAAGYRHIDTAAAYGNEAEVAAGVSQSGIPREELFVSGKLWNSKRSYDAAIKACRRSLKNLGLTYFDQYLIHWPASPILHDDWQRIDSEAWRALETLHAEGLVKTIGVCNYNVRHLDALLSQARICPMTNQIELHAGYVLWDTVRFCNDREIRLEAWSPLGNGTLLREPVFRLIADAHGCSAAQICLCYCIQHGALPITKTVSTAHMADNRNIAGLVLSQDEMALLDAMPLCGFSGLDPDTVTQFG